MPRTLANRIWAHTMTRHAFLPSTLRHTARNLALAAGAALTALTLQLGTAGTAHAQRAPEPVTLNFVNAEIDAVARTMATITGRNIVVDPRVKGTITLSTDKPVAPALAWNQFLATLRLSGFAVVDSAGLLKVVPEADAKLQGGPVQAEGAPPAGNQIVTQIFRLNHENPNSLVPLLRPLISPNNTINVNPGSNALVITDYADNLQRIARIIAALDVSNATDVEVLPLRHAVASDLAPLVARLMEGSGTLPLAAAPGQVADTSYRTQIIAEPRSNALVVRAANPARLNLVRSLVSKLDQPTSAQASGNIHVVYLKNADAVKLATTLRAAIAGTGGASAASSGPLNLPAPTPGTQLGMAASAATAPVQPSAQPSTGGQIQADPATNSLIITAPEPQYRQIRAVIDRLDQRRAQVFVESLIAEVNADRAAEFGIQWQGALGNKGDTNIGVLGTNFTIGGQNIISLSTQGASGNALPSPGLNLGLAHKTLGVYTLAGLARFLETNGDGNILSTPNLLTLDNEEAKIVIGQNVPFVTGQYTNANVGGTGAVNPFQTIERKDVGLTLRVKPQISENGTVKLQIYQEVSSVQASSVNSPSGLITNKRSIESNVLVEDGGIVVLGGLLQDEFSGNQQKLPGLGDVPLFGNLFKAETRSRKKTNLMVFLRPLVVRDAQQTESLSMDRYDQMRSRQEGARPPPNAVLPIEGAPALPNAQRRGTPPSTPAAPAAR
ncbi:MAG: putative secretin, ral secretion pathway protein component of type secretion system [Pseudomonadota bacterium]